MEAGVSLGEEPSSGKIWKMDSHRITEQDSNKCKLQTGADLTNQIGEKRSREQFTIASYDMESNDSEDCHTSDCHTCDERMQTIIALKKSVWYYKKKLSQITDNEESHGDEEYSDGPSFYDHMHQEDLDKPCDMNVDDGTASESDTDWSSCEENATEFNSGNNSTIRHVLAMLHFNKNIKRVSPRAKDGSVYYNVTYPKFKLGEEVVREVAVLPTYDYVNKPEQHFLEALNAMPLPTPISTSERRTRCCKKCKLLMKGHPQGHCPHQE
eukprot:gene5834-6531_t